MKKTYFAPQTICSVAVAEHQILALSIVEGNADPSNDVLSNENSWDDMWE